MQHTRQSNELCRKAIINTSYEKMDKSIILRTQRAQLLNKLWHYPDLLLDRSKPIVYTIACNSTSTKEFYLYAGYGELGMQRPDTELRELITKSSSHNSYMEEVRLRTESADWSTHPIYGVINLEKLKALRVKISLIKNLKKQKTQTQELNKYILSQKAVNNFYDSVDTLNEEAKVKTFANFMLNIETDVIQKIGLMNVKDYLQEDNSLALNDKKTLNPIRLKQRAEKFAMATRLKNEDIVARQLRKLPILNGIPVEDLFREPLPVKSLIVKERNHGIRVTLTQGRFSLKRKTRIPNKTKMVLKKSVVLIKKLNCVRANIKKARDWVQKNNYKKEKQSSFTNASIKKQMTLQK